MVLLFQLDTLFADCKLCDLWRYLDTARGRLQNVKGTSVKQCYTFVTEYDEESSNLPYWMQSIGSKYTDC